MTVSGLSYANLKPDAQKRVADVTTESLSSKLEVSQDLITIELSKVADNPVKMKITLGIPSNTSTFALMKKATDIDVLLNEKFMNVSGIGAATDGAIVFGKPTLTPMEATDPEVVKAMEAVREAAAAWDSSAKTAKD